MQTTPNLGMVIPSSDADAFDELVFCTALTTVDTWAGTVATTAFVTGSYAPLASPALTGTPTAPTPATGDNSTKIATTAFVKAQGYATLASPTFTGTPTAPTPAAADSSTLIATTAFVKAQGYLTAPISTSSSTGVGYGTGAGGTITQATSRTTAVTINKPAGQIITNSASLAAGAAVQFTVNNSTVASTDTIVLVTSSGNTSAAINYYVISVSTGSFVIGYVNNSVGALSVATTFNFAVVKAVTA